MARVTKKRRLRIDGVAVDLFWDPAVDSWRSGAVVILPGLPDFPGLNAWTERVVDSGRLAVQPHVCGSYDSDGTYSVAGARTALEAVDSALRHDQWELSRSERGGLGLNIGEVHLVGHSFGAHLAIRAVDVFERLAGVYCTGGSVHYAPRFGCKEDGLLTLQTLAWSHPYTYRIDTTDPTWLDGLRGADALPPTPLASVPAVRVLYGEHDKYFDVPLALANVGELINAYIDSDDVVIAQVPGEGHPAAESLRNMTFADVMSMRIS